MEAHLSPSLLLMHPAIPGTMNPQPVWELDGNTGFTAVVLEMLVQHSDRRLMLLPALPARWQKGRIRDVRAGPWRIRELRWEAPERLRLRLEGPLGEAAEIEWRGSVLTRRMPETGELTLTAADWEPGEAAGTDEQKGRSE